MEAEGSGAGREDYQEAEAGDEENQRAFLSCAVKNGSFAPLPLSCPLNLSPVTVHPTRPAFYDSLGNAAARNKHWRELHLI